MDLATRKNNLIERLIKIVSKDNIEKFEALANEEASGEEIIAHTIAREPVSRAQYRANNKEALNSYQQGSFKTQAEIRRKFSKK